MVWWMAVMMAVLWAERRAESWVEPMVVWKAVPLVDNLVDYSAE